MISTYNILIPASSDLIPWRCGATDWLGRQARARGPMLFVIMAFCKGDGTFFHFSRSLFE